jgi:hypothetical protein
VQFREYPLLNTPNLIAVMLRAAAAGTPSVADCAARLHRLLAQAGETPDVPPAKILRWLDGLRGHLAAARLVHPVGADRFTLTERGRAALAAHPAGFAIDDLMAYPEYAAGLASRAPAPLDPGSAAYDQGFAARQSGRPPTANPHASDTAAHLAWENGWSEALDEDTGQGA